MKKQEYYYSITEPYTAKLRDDVIVAEYIMSLFENKRCRELNSDAVPWVEA